MKDIVEEKNINKGNSPVYNLYSKHILTIIGFITHLGKSTLAGHYVAHILKNKEWVYYNDARVTTCDKPPFGKGFIYLFKNENN